jgi:hypothetical protein
MRFQVQAACQEAAREDLEPVQRVNNLRSATSAMGLHRCNAATLFLHYFRTAQSIRGSAGQSNFVFSPGG